MKEFLYQTLTLSKLVSSSLIFLSFSTESIASSETDFGQASEGVPQSNDQF